ncbi:MAG: hypothetical protein H7318_08280 [Oligoflexus sp.]|nr:hypothetical protein [Oligoflexus sp.]
MQKIFTSRWGSNFCAIHGSESKVACWGSLIYNSTIYDITSPSDLTQVKDIAITAVGYV